MPYLEYPTQDRKAARVGLLHQIRPPRIRLLLLPYSGYPTQDRKAIRVGPLHQLRLPRMRLSLVPYLKYHARDRKATRVGPLRQIWLLPMRLPLVPYLEYPTRNSHALLGIACYSEPYSGQKPYSGRCISYNCFCLINSLSSLGWGYIAQFTPHLMAGNTLINIFSGGYIVKFIP